MSKKLELKKSGRQRVKRVALFVLRDLGLFAAIAAVVAVMNLIFGKSCPSQLILNFDCPFCGMTRAHLAALRLDFAAAFSYHPLFFLGIPYLFLLFHEEIFKKWWKKAYFVVIIALTAFFLIRYILHLIFMFV